MSSKKETVEEAKVTEPIFTKDQVLASIKYSDRQDVINALWTDDKGKTLAEVDAMIDKFMKGTVK